MVGRALAPMFLHPLQYGEENLERAYSSILKCFNVGTEVFKSTGINPWAKVYLRCSKLSNKMKF